jgi:hypothetical protein
MSEVKEFVNGAGIKVLSVHATQGFMVDEEYVKWARPAMQIADDLGASSVTFHPNQVKRERLECQSKVKKHLRELQEGFRAIAALETFSGNRRIFRPKEIMDAGLPMVLDTAHLKEERKVLWIIKQYHQNIPAVHLSARGHGEHHLPIDSFCLQVVKMLDEHKWDGSLILEYLPWHHYRMKDDLKLLERFLAGEKNIEIPPPDDRYRDDNTKWGYLIDPDE